MSDAPDLLARVGLRAAADGIRADNPDRTLLLDVAALRAAEQTRHETYKNWTCAARDRVGTPAEAKASFHAAAEVYDTLRAKVIAQRARTQDGAIAKLRFVMDTDDENVGTQSELHLSAIRDAMAVGFACGLADNAPSPTKRRKQGGAA